MKAVESVSLLELLAAARVQERLYDAAAAAVEEPGLRRQFAVIARNRGVLVHALENALKAENSAVAVAPSVTTDRSVGSRPDRPPMRHQPEPRRRVRPPVDPAFLRVSVEAGDLATLVSALRRTEEETLVLFDALPTDLSAPVRRVVAEHLAALQDVIDRLELLEDLILAHSAGFVEGRRNACSW